MLFLCGHFVSAFLFFDKRRLSEHLLGLLAGALLVAGALLAVFFAQELLIELANASLW